MTQTEKFTYGVPEAGEMIGLSRNGSYDAAARGEIPTFRVGRLLKVPKQKWDQIVSGEVAPTKTTEAG